MITDFLFTIEGLLMLGFVVGGLISYFLSQRIGCIALISIPITAIIFVNWWLKNTPENTSSTSALAYVFVPLWPSIGAFVAYIVISLIKSRYKNLDE